MAHQPQHQTPGLDALRPHLSAAAWEFLRQRPDVAQSCLQSPEILLRIKFIYDQVAAGLPPPTPEAAVAHARQQLRLLSGPAPLDQSTVPAALPPPVAPQDAVPPNLTLPAAPAPPPALPRPWTAPFEFSLLPVEVVLHVLTYCDSTTLVQAERTCRVFRTHRPGATAQDGSKITVADEAAMEQCKRMGVTELSPWNAATDRSWKRQLQCTTRVMDQAWMGRGGKLEGHLCYFQGGVTSVCVSPDGENIITGSADGTAKIWELRTGNLVRSLEKHLHTGEVSSVCVCKNGQYVITGSDDRTACFWDLRTGNLVRTVEHHTGVTSVAASPGDLHVVTGSVDHSVWVWDQLTGMLVRTLLGDQNIEHLEAVTAVCVSPDGEYVISGSRDKTAKVWALQTGVLHCTLVGHTDHVTSVCVSRDGTQVLTGSRDMTVGVWDLATGQMTRMLAGHTMGVRSVAVSLDGIHVLTGSDDRTAKLWNLQSGEVLKTLEGHSNGINSVCMSPDGEHAITGSADGTARVWAINGMQGGGGYQQIQT